MTWTPRTQKPQEVNAPSGWPFPRPHPICIHEHCPILTCCAQAGKCLGTDGGLTAEVEDALL
jgi:hypothetical protein